MARWLGLWLLINGSWLYAEQPLINQHERGWYWHHEVKDSQLPEEPPAAVKTSPADPMKTWQLIGQQVERAHAAAILKPTSLNIANARRLQRLLVAQAALFAERWMLDLLLHPEQDEQLINPTNSMARDVYHQQDNSRKEAMIATISKTAGLFYFYDGGEPYSLEMANVVHEFAHRYQIAVIPIAMNAQFSPLFPQSHVENGEARQLGVKHIPAVFVVNPTNGQTMPVAYGLVSQAELKDNIWRAAHVFKSRAA